MSRLWAFVLFAGSVLAQTPDTATVHGQVTDSSHAAVAGVQVAVKNTVTGLERTVEMPGTEESGDSP